VQHWAATALSELVAGHPVSATAAVQAGTIELAVATCARFAAETEAHEEASTLLHVLRLSTPNLVEPVVARARGVRGSHSGAALPTLRLPSSSRSSSSTVAA
jgi:hypothetical protein